MTSAQPSRCFSLADILAATKNFDKKLIIGKGGFGTVYKGQISTQVVAVKRLGCTSNQGESQFRIEIDVLLKLRHCNLVSLVGYCDEHNEKILVYEYMPNGNLNHRLHDKGDAPLSWVTRLKIALGAARGLDYLHTGVGTRHAVIHRDVKSSNILLDENMSAMVSDFGLCKICPTNQLVSCVNASVKGTFGYLSPEVYNTGKLTRKTDVYAFGVVLLELLTGRWAQGEQNKNDQCGLVSWAEKCIKEKRFDQMVDPKIKGTFSSSRFSKQFATIAYRCVQSDLKDRPTMTEVVAALQALLEKSNHASGSSSTSGFSWKCNVSSFASMTKRNSADQSGSSSQMKQHVELVFKGVKMFTYDELKIATRGFGIETFVGEGRYGKVYKGWVDKTTYSPCKDDTGLPIAVKKLHRCKPYSNLEMLKEFHHPNLVNLIGRCFKGRSLFLVYEFMHKGNFEDLLRNGVVARLPLLTKEKIAIGIARGIVFLQKPQLHPTICHSKLNRRTILMDEDFTPKLSDYDVTFIVNGKYDKASPDFHGNDLVLKTDLSGYEVIFEEVLTGVRLDNSNIVKIDRFFRHYWKQSLRHVAQLCFAICNEVDSENKMLTMLEQHDKLIRKKLKIWLTDPKN